MPEPHALDTTNLVHEEPTQLTLRDGLTLLSLGNPFAETGD